MRFAAIPAALAVAGSLLAAPPPARAQSGAEVVTHIIDEPGWLGITPDSLDPLTIGLVAAGTPAARVGLLPGDRITSIDGRTATRQALIAHRFRVGDRIRLTVVRGARRLGPYTLDAVENPYAAYVLARAREDSLWREAERYRWVLVRSAGRGAVAGPLDTVRIGNRYFVTRRLPLDSTFQSQGAEGEGGARGLFALSGKVAGVPILRRPDTASSDIRGPAVRGDGPEAPLPAPQQRGDTSAAATVARLRAELAAQEGRLRDLLSRDAAGSTGLVARVGVRQAIAGAEIAQINPGLAHYFRVADGVLVLNVPGESPAAVAGLRPGDVITAVNGARVATIAQLLESAEGARGPIALAVVRGGERVALTLRR